jgi:pseudouridine-5'-phosphate glycosidase
MSKAPAVALESTVISHGLPYPHNLRLALRLEEIVHEGGAAPARIAIIVGKCGRSPLRLAITACLSPTPHNLGYRRLH